MCTVWGMVKYITIQLLKFARLLVHHLVKYRCLVIRGQSRRLLSCLSEGSSGGGQGKGCSRIRQRSLQAKQKTPPASYVRISTYPQLYF